MSLGALQEAVEVFQVLDEIARNDDLKGPSELKRLSVRNLDVVSERLQVLNALTVPINAKQVARHATQCVM